MIMEGKKIVLGFDKYGIFFAVLRGPKVLNTTRNLQDALTEAGRNAPIEDTNGGKWRMEGRFLVTEGLQDSSFAKDHLARCVI